MQIHSMQTSGAPEPAWRRALRALFKDDESGQAMVEFVLVFPLQIWVTLAIIQFAFLMHAHVVVQQAAFLGARAAAVAETMPKAGTPQQAARRMVARQVAVITTADGHTFTPITPPQAHERLRWQTGAKDREFGAARQSQAYSLLKQVSVDSSTSRQGYLTCEVKYDYLLGIPVANHLFTKFDRSGSRNEHKLTTFRIHRVGFMATPWTVAPK